jgi:hypothetical protein
MSSWNNGKAHFRERKTRVQPQLPIASQQIIQINPTNDTSNPSKYVLNKTNNKGNDAVICAIAFEEEPYIDEWIRYNIALGFSHIYIYDNSESNTLKDRNSTKVSVFHYPGDKQMFITRNIFCQTYKTKHTWVAHIDIDEFIVLKKHTTIIDFLNEYNDCESIALNWIMFGTSNEIEYRDEPITKRFQMCSKSVNDHYKCITKIKNIDQCLHSHRPVLHSGYIYDTNRKIVNNIYNPDGDNNIACIHHYYSKSEEEFKLKIRRKMVDEAPKRDMSLLNGLHLRDNDIYNSDAWDFYSKHI